MKSHLNEEIDILKKHYDIKYQVYAADQESNAIWDGLINEFSEAELSNIVILFNNQGRIINIMEPNCNCLDSFILENNKIISDGI